MARRRTSRRCARTASGRCTTFQNRRHHPNLEVMRVLLDAGASAQVCDGAGNSVLQYAWCSGDELAVGVVMKALNWHLHAPESPARARRPPSCRRSAPTSRRWPPTTTRADLSAPPPPPPVAGEAAPPSGRRRRRPTTRRRRPTAAARAASAPRPPPPSRRTTPRRRRRARRRASGTRAPPPRRGRRRAPALGVAAAGAGAVAPALRVNPT